MAIRRVSRKTERTPEEAARLHATRDEFCRTRPGLDELVASGNYDGPFRQADVEHLLSVLAELKRDRERRGLSLADVSERSGLDKGMLSRLENGKILNPTISTLWRYSEAVGERLSLAVERPSADHAASPAG